MITGAGHEGDESIQLVNVGLLDRTLKFILEKAVQNHKLHESWNEGSNGDFMTCTRGDCMEAKVLLGEWNWGHL